VPEPRPAAAREHHRAKEVKELEDVSGILKLSGKGGGVLRDPARSLIPTANDVHVSPKLIREYALPEGAVVSGPVRTERRQRELVDVRSVCGLTPEQFRKRTPFKELIPIDPRERYRLGASGDISMRLIELIAPIGKGTRGLIVSPPKAGKTIMLEQISKAVLAAQPDTRLVMLLIDERPEEVTHISRSVPAEVYASTSDQTPQIQVELAELLLAHIRIDLECGRDIVVLVDSLTRMGRAFNVRGSGTRRTMSGGMEAGALEIPRRFFGLARNIEGGGSVTIIATALIETGSQMDQLIFQEFKGTGNSEIVLDRKLAEQRIFPAININESGTRKEELLYTPEEIGKIALIRRGVADRPPKEAMEMLLTLVKKHSTNDALLASIPLS